MKKNIILAALAAITITFTTGCKTNSKQTEALVQSATYIAATIAMQESPDVRIYLNMVTPIVCHAAGNSLRPEDWVPDVDVLPKGDGYGPLLINGLLPLALAYLDDGDTNSYNAWLSGSCKGLSLATGSAQPPAGVAASSARVTTPANHRYPHIRIRK